MVANMELAALFGEMAALVKIADGSTQSFRARAYEAAAKTLEGLPTGAAELSETELKKLPGIGGATAAKIREYADSGRIAKLEQLREEFPSEFRALVNVPGLGPKRAVQLRDALGVGSAEELAAALEAGAVRELPGFGERMEANLRRAMQRLGMSGKERRTPILAAMKEAEWLVAEVRALPGVEAALCCGSLRRFRDTVADLDILVGTSDSGAVTERLVNLGWIQRVIASGGAKTSVVSQSGLQVDVRMVPTRRWGAAVLYFTGSQAHNIRLRQLAIRRGWSLNEYALSDADTGEEIAAGTEEEIYAALGLPWIPPPIREDRGEIEAGQGGGLPDLVTDGDLRGDLHVHTDLSGDGDHSLEAMLAAAAEMGLEYIAITDHAEKLAVNGASREEMLAQRLRIAALQEDYPGMRILHGAELNIAPDGSLDYDRDFLMGYDWCVASVHSYFDLPAAEQTERLAAAIRHPAVNAVGHLLGRRIGRRPGIEVDVEAVLDAAESTGTAIEINSHLDRLDAPVEVLWQARDRPGVRFVVSTDAHRVGELAQSRWGVLQAQRGWVDKSKVANTWPLGRFLDWVRAVRRGEEA